MNLRKLLFVVPTLFVGSLFAQNSLEDNPQVKFALEELAKVDKNVELNLKLRESLGKESFSLQPTRGSLTIEGGDYTGVMYGILEVAEQLGFGTKIGEIEAQTSEPYIENRGLKINFPLDARTPSYDDTGDSAQNNILVMWEWEYWKDLIDDMARSRYNLLTLWSNHPFPSMIKVPEFPNVALDDIYKYTETIDATIHRDWHGRDIQAPENLKLIKKISIDEKIAFWSKVLTYADDMGIDVHLYTWNVYVNSAAGKDGITWSQEDPVTADYIRKSVKQLLLTYPTIDGIGVTAGEHINRKLEGRYSTENWIYETYGQGIMDAKYFNKDIDVRFIFRQHWSSWDVISDAFRNYDGVLESSFKYSRARMYSSPTPPWFDRIFRSDVEKYGFKCWLNVRNDDLFNFRWGDPVYANEYIKNMPRALSPGYFVGPDGYVLGRTFNSKDPECQGQFDFHKHWYNFMIWGRAGYDPNLGEEFYEKKIAQKFPKTNSATMYNTWRATSDVISWIDKIYYRPNDFQFIPEQVQGTAIGSSRIIYINLNHMIAMGSMPSQGVISIANYANGVLDEGNITPFDAADKLDAAAKTLLAGAKSIKPGNDSQLRETLVDFESMAYLARYYADKTRAATYLAIYKVGGEKSDKSKALRYAKLAVKEWEAYAAAATKAYTPQLYARGGELDWYKILEDVKGDVKIVEETQYDGKKLPKSYDNRLWIRAINRI